MLAKKYLLGFCLILVAGCDGDSSKFSVEDAGPIVGRSCDATHLCPCGYLCGVGGKCEVAATHPACTDGSAGDALMTDGSVGDALMTDGSAGDALMTDGSDADPVVGRSCGAGNLCPCGYLCGVGGKCEVADTHPPCDSGM